MLAELLLLDRLRRPFRLLVLVAAVIVAGALGIASLAVQRHFAAEQASGANLGAFQQVLAEGSSARTAWPGWLAAFLFALSLVRLARGRPEPPMGRPRGRDWTVAEMRRALHREYTAVRLAIVVVSAVALVDAARAAVFAVAAFGGDDVARGSLVATGVEAGGLVAAALVLGLWGATFARQLARWGAR